MDATPLFKPINDRRVFEAIVGQLEEAIVGGRLSVGDRLPSERELAHQFGVARTSVREALRVLEALGVIRARPGTERGAMMVAGSGNAFRDVLRFQLALQRVKIASLVEFRIVIESWAAGAAASRGTGGDMEQLRGLVVAMKEPELSPAEFLILDADFHLGIARLSGNEVLVLVLEGARSAIERIMRDALTMASRDEWPSVRARLAAEHEDILVAIESGDTSRAAQLVSSHISAFYAQTLMQRDSSDGFGAAELAAMVRSASAAVE